jgi:hypothetical protein
MLPIALKWYNILNFLDKLTFDIGPMVPPLVGLHFTKFSFLAISERQASFFGGERIATFLVTCFSNGIAKTFLFIFFSNFIMGKGT